MDEWSVEDWEPSYPLLSIPSPFHMNLTMVVSDRNVRNLKDLYYYTVRMSMKGPEKVR